MNTPRKIANSSSLYYGWVITAVGLVSMAFWFGIRSSFSVFYVALLEDFSWNRGDSAGVQSMALITYTILAPIVGGLIDRFGPRRVIVPGILVLVLGLVLCAATRTLTDFYLFYGVIVGTGVTCVGIVSYSAILAHWFERKRGLASGIAVSGMGLGTFFLVPLSQRFISMWGWRLTFIMLAGLVFTILLPVNGLFLSHKPEDLGQRMDGEEVDPQDQSFSGPKIQQNLPPDWTMGKVFRSGHFWALMTFPFFSVIGIYIILVHNVRFLVDQGIEKMAAAFIFAMAGVVSSVFRIFWGWLSDHIGRETTYSVGLLFGCMGTGSLLLLETTGMKGLVYPFFIFFGMGWGVTAPMFMSVAADLFKGQAFGLIYGLVEGGIGIAGAFGAWIAGFIYDRTQSYYMAFVIVIVVFIVSAFFIWLAAPRKLRP